MTRCVARSPSSTQPLRCAAPLPRPRPLARRARLGFAKIVEMDESSTPVPVAEEARRSPAARLARALLLLIVTVIIVTAGLLFLSLPQGQATSVARVEKYE